MNALTQFPSGGGDILMGSVTAPTKRCTRGSSSPHAFGAWGGVKRREAVLRSLPTLALRYEAQDKSGACWRIGVPARPEIARVLHPAMPGSPGHEHWQGL